MSHQSPVAYLATTGSEVEAMKLEDDNLEAVAAWVDGEVVNLSNERFDGKLSFAGIRLRTIQDQPQYARVGEWVVRYRPSRRYTYIFPDKHFQNNFEIL
jgi:hypothetical protein